MLEALIEYAKLNQLIVEPGFTTKRVHWLVKVSKTGRVQGVVQADGNNRRTRQFPCCPDLQQPDLVSLPNALKHWSIEAKQAAHFMLDSCQRVVLYPQSEQQDQKTLEQHQTFVALIRLASQQVKILQPVAKTLLNISQLVVIRQELHRLNASGTDKISFSVDGTVVLEDTSWHDWWRNFLKQTFPTPKTREMISLVSGETITPTLTHPKITSLTEGEVTFGASIVSVNKVAFESFGLSQGQHAALSVESAAAYRAALEHLLQKNRIFHGAKTIYWYDQIVPDRLDPLALLFKRDYAPEANYRTHLEEILQMMKTQAKLGKVQLRETKCHIAVLREQQNRARILMHHTQTIQNVTLALLSWLDDTAISGISGAKSVVDLPYEFRQIFQTRTTKIGQVQAKSDKKRTDNDDIRANDFQPLLVVLYQAILNPNLPIPMALVSHSLKAIFSSMVNKEFQVVLGQNSASSMRLECVLYARLGILKAFFYRSGDRYLQPQLNTKHPNPYYQAGRLTALLEFVSRIHDSQNAQLSSHKLFLQAVRTPISTIQMEIEISQRKLKKLEKNRPWLKNYLRTEMNRIWEIIHGSIPPNTTLEHQSLFTLGFFQQFAVDQVRIKSNTIGDLAFKTHLFEESKGDV